MEQTKKSLAQLALVKLFCATLKFRINVIDVTGKRGRADDIRALTRALHFHAVESLERIIPEWSKLSDTAKDHYVASIYEYVDKMRIVEYAALSLLKNMLDKVQDPTAQHFIQDAIQAHTQITENTLGLQAMLDWTKDNISGLSTRLDAKPNLLDEIKLQQERSALIAKLQGPKL